MKPYRVVNRATAFADISEYDAKCKGIYALNPVEMEQSESAACIRLARANGKAFLAQRMVTPRNISSSQIGASITE